MHSSYVCAVVYTLSMKVELRTHAARPTFFFYASEFTGWHHKVTPPKHSLFRPSQHMQIWLMKFKERDKDARHPE